MKKDEILVDNKSLHGLIAMKNKYEDLSCLKWIPKLHKDSYKQMKIDALSVCSTKELSVKLIKSLPVVKEGLQKYCDSVCSSSGINRIPMDSKTLKRTFGKIIMSFIF